MGTAGTPKTLLVYKSVHHGNTAQIARDYKARKWIPLGIISKVEPVNKWPDNTREIVQRTPADVFSRPGEVSEPAPKRGGDRN